MIFIFIYKITNTINNKFYIGKTTNSVIKRFNEHISNALRIGACGPLYDAIRKYGKENFTITIIDFAESEEELNKKEIHWIYTLNAMRDGYNATTGGEGGNTYQFKTGEELSSIKLKLSESKKSKKNPNHKSVKCKNIKTNTEIFFDTVNECRIYFGESNHNFITRRCNKQTKYAYRKEWIFAYADEEYIDDYTIKKSNWKKKKIKIICIDTNKEYYFDSYKEAANFFGLEDKYFSSKAYKHKNKEYWQKSNYKIFILE